jgi:hypothetical protein
LFSFFVAFNSVQAVKTIVTYPELDGAIVPGGDVKPGEELPQFIKYIFTFSLGAVGVLGLLAIIFGAFTYLTAVGNPQQAAKAKEQIFSALLGILLLLGSYILLNTINPDLIKLGVKLESIEFEERDTNKYYSCYCCDMRKSASCGKAKTLVQKPENLLNCRSWRNLNAAKVRCKTSCAYEWREEPEYDSVQVWSVAPVMNCPIESK